MSSPEASSASATTVEQANTRWIAGASTAVTGWRWITDEPWYAQWGANDCGADNYCDADALTLGRCSSSRDPVSYNDWPSGKSFCVNHVVMGMIVEWSADCNGDGEVDYRQIREGVLADADRDMIPDCCEANSGCCAGDLDLSGATDGTDLALVLSLWGTNAADAPAADIDRNGVVDAADMALVLSSWGPCR